MKTTGHGIEDSKDVANMYHMRLMALLQELVRDRGYKGAARVLEIDQRTVAESARTGRLSRRVREALERALQEGVGSAAARQRERNEKLEERLRELEEGHEALGKEARRRLSKIEGSIEALQRDGVRTETTGAGDAGDGPSHGRVEGSEEGTPGRNGKPPAKTSMRREYPELATLEPADDDEDVFGDSWPLIVEWRELKASHPNDGKGLAWLVEKERLLEVELALLEERGMTLPPEKQPLHGLDRSGQINWRRAALYDTRRARAKRELPGRILRAIVQRLLRQ